jgi:hypothetical protein
VKEARYHQQHAADWVVRLGQGTDESAAAWTEALQLLWRYGAELFDADAVDEHASASGLGPRWSELVDAWEAEMQQAARRGRPRHARRRRSAAPASAACTASTWASSWPRCSTCSAPIREACGDTRRRRGSMRLGGAGHRARPRGAGAVGARPGHRARRDRPRRRARGRADAHLLRLPGDRSDRAERAGRHRAEGLGPARATLRRAPAWTTDWISDEGRASCASTASRRPATVTPRRRAPIRIFRRKPATASPAPAAAAATPNALSAFGSTACKALYRCLACREPFEHFKPYEHEDAKDSQRTPQGVHCAFDSRTPDFRVLRVPFARPAVAMNTPLFHPLTVRRVQPDTPEAVIVSFDVPEDLRPVFGFTQGQYLTLRKDIDGQDLRRSYSICAGVDDGELRVGVRKVRGGVFSNWINERSSPATPSA